MPKHAAKETAPRILARIRSFQQYWSDNEAERVRNRRAIDNGPDAFTGEVLMMDGEGNPIPLTVLNFYTRLRGRIEAKCFDESPEITYPREATGAEKIADGVGRLISRVTEESGLPGISRDGITSVLTEGGYGVVYGMPNIPDFQQVNELAKGAGQILEETVKAVQPEAGAFDANLGSVSMTPSPTPVPGQDHDTIAQVLQTTATDPINILANAPEVTDALLEKAAEHVEAQDREDKSENYWRYDDNKIYAEMVEIGSHLAFDLKYGDHRRGSWLAHAIELTLDEARSHPMFKPSVRERLVVSVPDEKDAKVGTNLRRVKVDGETADEHNAENGVVRIWVYYDKKRQKRHFVPEALESGEIEFLERDDKNPYLDQNGRPLLPWFWPVGVCVNRKSAQRGPHRGLPIPYMRNGWDQQIESIKFDTAVAEGTKAAMADRYVIHEGVDEDTMQAISSGRMHVAVKRPDALERGEKILEAVEFKPPLEEAFAERENQLTRFCMSANIPRAVMTSVAQAETLGQEELGMSGGDEAMFDLGRSLECFYAEVAYGMLLIASAKMPPEIVAEYMGQELEGMWDAWRHAARRGDMLRVKFSPTTREQNPVRAKQLLDVTQVAQAMLDPVTGLPLVDPGSIFRVFNEAVKCLGVGNMDRFQPTPEQIAMLQAKAQEQMSAQGGGNPPNREGGGKPQGKQSNERPERQGGGRQQRQHGPPGRGQIDAAARRA